MKVRPKVSQNADFFDYFPTPRPHHRWGVYATSFGQAHVPAGSAYPPEGHPQNHFLSWQKGRVLRNCQVLYISEGEGEFESEVTGRCRVRAGSLMLLFPGVWHRYRPSPAVGWDELWIELGGRQIDDLRRSRVITPKEPIHRVDAIPEMLRLLTAGRQLALGKAPGFQVRLGLLGLQILTYVPWPPSPPGSSSLRIEQVVREALDLLGPPTGSPPSPESIARRLHVSYSYFRRAFKAQTGFSPAQYRLEVRFRRTCDFLRNTDKTIKEIAALLEYDSPFHLSLDFKKRTAVSPRQWRANGAK